MTLKDVAIPTLIARSTLLEDDCVRILDRRTFPLKTEYVVCRDYEEVAVAIEEMVTQSAGPFFAASAAMVLAARTADGESAESRIITMHSAADRLRRTRPTNNNIREAIALIAAEAVALVNEPSFSKPLAAKMYDIWSERLARSDRLGEYAASLISSGDTILTHCWGELSLISTLRSVLLSGKSVKVICTETRPYLQGARLTAHSVAEMGIDVMVITDNMAAHAMDRGMVSALITAADRVTLSGHIINKVGTYQLAIAAQNFGIPFVAMVQRPDRSASTPDDVPMEERDGAESLHCLGMPTASPLAHGWYPAFDVTPPRFVSAVATSTGIFHPSLIRANFS
jgi:methylthioribose-1-phosphate isomerase